MKVFVSDLDGTLYPPNVTDSGEENRAAIRRWREAGNVFAVATARIHQSYPKVAEDLGFAVDYLGGNGAELIFSDQTRIFRTLKASIFLQLAAWLKREGIDATIKANCGGQWISSDRNHYPYSHPSQVRMSLKQSRTLEEMSLSAEAEIVNLGILIHPDQRDRVKERCVSGGRTSCKSSARMWIIWILSARIVPKRRPWLCWRSAARFR